MVRTPGLQPATIHPTRSFAIMHLAMYDAVNAIDGSHQAFVTNLISAPAFASEEAAAAAAAHEVLLQLYPASRDMVDSQFRQSMGLVPEGIGKTLGWDLGQSVADRLLLQRTNDGANATPVPYVFGSAPGDFQSPAPTFPAQPQFSHWAHVTPFALAQANQVRPGPPPALTSSDYALAFEEVKTLGMTNSTVASADQALIGRFWNGAVDSTSFGVSACISHHTPAARLLPQLINSLSPRERTGVKACRFKLKLVTGNGLRNPLTLTFPAPVPDFVLPPPAVAVACGSLLMPPPFSSVV